MRPAIHWRAFSAALVVLAIGVGFLAWAKSYPPKAAAVPTLVAWITIALALIDAAASTETRLGRVLRRLARAENVVEWKTEGDREASSGRIVSSIFWVLAYLASVVVAGFLLATPAYVFLYMKLHGAKPARASAIAAVLTTFAVWFTFQTLFRYPLYPGLLFGGY